MKYLIPIFCLVFLCGCVDQKGTINQNTKDDIKELIREVTAGLPTPNANINVPPNQKVDLEEIKNHIHASSNNTANQMTGAINANVSKLAEIIKGAEVNLEKLAEINNKMVANLNSNVQVGLNANATANAQIRASLENTIAVTSEMKASLDSIVNINNQMSADLKVMNEMSAKLNANANVLAGIGGKIENLNMDLQAGRDVNYLPKEAVYMVGILIGAVVLVAALVTFLFHRSSMAAMRFEAQSEADERKKINQLLMRAMAVLPMASTGGDGERAFPKDNEVQALMKDIKQAGL